MRVVCHGRRLGEEPHRRGRERAAGTVALAAGRRAAVDEREYQADDGQRDAHEDEHGFCDGQPKPPKLEAAPSELNATNVSGATWRPSAAGGDATPGQPDTVTRVTDLLAYAGRPGQRRPAGRFPRPFRHRRPRPDLPRRQLARPAAASHPRPAARRDRRGVGRRADPRLGPLDRAGRAGRRRARRARRRAAGRGGAGRLDQRQPLQAGRRRARRPARPAGDRHRRRQLPDRPVRAAGPGRRARPGAAGDRDRHRRRGTHVRRASPRSTTTRRWSACRTWRTGPARSPTSPASPRRRTTPAR